MMDRRTFMAAGGGALLVGIGGAGAAIGFDTTSTDENASDRPTTASDPPEAVAASKPLATAFYKRINGYYPEVHVYVRRNGELVMQYTSDSDGPDGLRTEFNNIATEFASLVKTEGYEPKTLSIVVGEVQALVAEPAVRAYANGNLNREAFGETIQVMDVDRTD